MQKENDKLQLDMIELEKKLMEQQRGNKKLLSTQLLELKQQLAKVKEEHVILWTFVEEQKVLASY